MLRLPIENTLDREEKIMAEWVERKISDIGTVVGGATPSTKKLENYEDGKIAWITPKDLSTFSGRYIERGERNITEIGLKSCSTQLLPPNTVLFSSRAPIGYVAIAANEVCTNQGFKSVIPNKNTDPLFLFYLLKYNKDKIEGMGSGTTFKEVSGNTMKNIVVNVPTDKKAQEKIAAILDSIDDKIEENEQINNNLEQQMQAIFNAFFLTFDLHTYSTYMETEYGRIPSNWQFMELGNANLDISDGNYSSKYPKQNEFLSSGIPFIRGTDFNGTSISQSDMLYISPEKHSELKKGHTKRGDILITTRGEIGRIAFVPDSLVDVNINSQLVRINGSNIVPRSYLACYLTSTKVQNDFKTLTSGSALQQLPIGKLKKVMFLLPDNETLEKFDSIVEPLFIQVFANNEENIRLSQLRDTLLPNLMSGELDVSDIEI